MSRLFPVMVLSYRDCRVHVLDDGALGWAVVLCDEEGAMTLTLRDEAPHGLASLLAQAKAHLDRDLVVSAERGAPGQRSRACRTSHS